ncbi:hypothetical protein [Bariatricus sp. SGI.019]|uniref:hypothetical protein n=1 Tax=Bariatricus sp. SGI.019 TaxID=3420548 RepID=UPI003D037AFC
MDYVITNPTNKIFIRLDSKGSPQTCVSQMAQRFEFSKAKNILTNLPKTLKNFGFRVEPVPEIPIKNSEKEKAEPKVLQKDNYIVSENISRWIEKFGMCDDIIKEARERKEELIAELSNVDKEISNIIHQIELEDSVDLYRGWLERNQIKAARERRRTIKDELIIISSVLKADFHNLDRNNVRKSVEGLSNRKFTLRIVEDGDEDAV